MNIKTLFRTLVWAQLGLTSGILTIGAEANTLRRVEFREPHAGVYVIQPGSGTNVTDKVRPASTAGPAWTQAQLEGSTSVVELGDRVVLQLEPGRSLDTFLAGRKLTLSRTITPTLFILQAADCQAAIDAAEALSQQEGVRASYPVMRRPLRRHDAYAPAPNDPSFSEQWHLDNRGDDGNRIGPDLNARAVWPITRGQGVLVAVVDDGFQLDHPELSNRAADAPHYNFYRNRADGSPASSDADHATAVAGLIAAEQGNSRGS